MYESALILSLLLTAGIASAADLVTDVMQKASFKSEATNDQASIG
ncbi:MAG: hypothetical protein H6R19_1905 [Proteobacteria bacterium]|nr:hypothetical protein [Pseudomonadota bacterium]